MDSLERKSYRAFDPIRNLTWYSRGYVPHVQSDNIIQFVTFRLYDSIPSELIDKWKNEIRCMVNVSENKKQVILLKNIAKYEDAGYGQRFLSNPDCALIVQDNLKYYDGKDYRLLSWCIMPNHVHVLIEILSEKSLGEIVRKWKNFSAKECNKLLGRTGTFWMRDYYDRYIRNDNHLGNVIRYIEGNPVSAKLVANKADWIFSSAHIFNFKKG